MRLRQPQSVEKVAETTRQLLIYYNLKIIATIAVKLIPHFIFQNQNSKNRRIYGDFVFLPTRAWSTFVHLSARVDKFHLTLSTSASFAERTLNLPFDKYV